MNDNPLGIKGLQYIVDGKAHKKAVLIPYKDYLQLLEDFADLRVMLERREEPVVDFETVAAELRAERGL